MSEASLNRYLSQMQLYYSRRAGEYEAIYYRPDGARKRELGALVDHCRQWFDGRRVLEVACGTGYWTHAICAIAESVLATDGSQEMLALAREKGLPDDKVQLRIADAYTLDGVSGRFDAGMANFWISHVPKRRLDAFLRNLHGHIGAGARVMMMDNVHIEGVGGELTHVEGIEDEFRIRELADGTRHVVLKNYYQVDELNALYSAYANDLRVEVSAYYWWVTYTVR